MQDNNKIVVNWAVPNFVNVCVDAHVNGELAGRFYHKYDKEPVKFEHFMDMVKQMEQMYDAIDYPQATSHKRSFIKDVKSRTEKKSIPPVVWEGREFSEERGSKATFYVLVRGRGNATWQGEVVWVERGISKKFRSVMELMILMDNALK